MFLHILQYYGGVENPNKSLSFKQIKESFERISKRFEQIKDSFGRIIKSFEQINDSIEQIKDLY